MYEYNVCVYPYTHICTHLHLSVGVFKIPYACCISLRHLAGNCEMKITWNIYRSLYVQFLQITF